MKMINNFATRRGAAIRSAALLTFVGSHVPGCTSNNNPGRIARQSSLDARSRSKVKHLTPLSLTTHRTLSASRYPTFSSTSDFPCRNQNICLRTQKTNSDRRSFIFASHIELIELPLIV